MNIKSFFTRNIFSYVCLIFFKKGLTDFLNRFLAFFLFNIQQLFVYIFQILRNHVMVRVGGGWDTLQHYLDKHDPCRCAKGKHIFQNKWSAVCLQFYSHSGHKSASSAQITMRNGRNGPVAVGVCYDRYVRKKSPNNGTYTKKLSLKW